MSTFTANANARTDSEQVFLFDSTITSTNEPNLNWNHILQKNDEAGTPVPVVYGFTPIAKELLEVDSRETFLNSNKSDFFKKSLESMICKSTFKVLSLDVFDTILLRNDKSEAHRYYELSERILSKLRENRLLDAAAPLTATDLCLSRVEALRVNYRIRKPVSGCIEGSIKEVLETQVASLNLKSSCYSLFLEEEIAYEIENLSVNPVILDIAKQFSKNNGEVILLSDMYLDGKIIEKIVRGVIPKKFYSKIYSSSDLVVSKRSGKIFSKVEQDLGKSSEDFIHLGDSWLGDVNKAKSAGWSAIHVPVSVQEVHKRNLNLHKFVDRMQREGIDVSTWAKV